MKLRNVFWIGLFIWIGGALIGTLGNSLLIKEIAVNIFGSLTILLGLFLLARLAWRKVSGNPSADTSKQMLGGQPSAFSRGRGMAIYSTVNVPAQARDLIERAIQNDNFKPKGKTGSGRELIYIPTPTQDWLAVVEVTDAIMVTAAYPTSADKVDQQVADYLAA